MYKFFNIIIDIWNREINNKIKLAYQTDTTLPTIYKVLNKDGYNINVISQMWNDIQDVITDEEKLQIIGILNLL